MICRHCEKRKAVRPRGLCTTCYYAPGVRDLYTPAIVCGPATEPTMEQVEALIAEQMKHLPAWWYRSEAQMDGRED